MTKISSDFQSPLPSGIGRPRNIVEVLESLHSAATPGEWSGGGNSAAGYGWVQAQEDIRDTFGHRRQILVGQYKQMADDAKFIITAHNHMPGLLNLAKLVSEHLVADQEGNGLVRKEAMSQIRQALQSLGVPASPEVLPVPAAHRGIKP